MVGGENDRRRVPQPELVDRGQDPAHLLVDQADVSPIDGDQLAPVVGGETVERPVRRVVRLYSWLVVERLGHRRRQLDLRRVVAVVVILGDAVRQVRAEPVAAEEERPAGGVDVPRVVAQPLDGALGQEVLEGGLDRLVEHAREQVAGLAVREGPAHLRAQAKPWQTVGLEIAQVVRVLDRVAPPGVVLAVEPGGIRAAPLADVPLADMAELVAGGLQVTGERHVRVVQLLPVAHVALVVGQQGVPERQLSGEQRGPCRGTDRGRRERMVEPRARLRERVECRRLADGVPVAAQRVYPVLVGHQEQDVRPAFHPHPPSRRLSVVGLRPRGQLSFLVSALLLHRDGR